jgi:hypothetical protein
MFTQRGGELSFQLNRGVAANVSCASENPVTPLLAQLARS